MILTARIRFGQFLILLLKITKKIFKNLIKFELTNWKMCDIIIKSSGTTAEITKLFKKISKKYLTKWKRCDIIEKLSRLTEQHLEN